MSESSNNFHAGNEGRAGRLDPIFDLVSEDYDSARILHQGGGEFRYLLATTIDVRTGKENRVQKGIAIAKFVLAETVDPRAQHELLEVGVRTTELEDYNSASEWLIKANPDRFFVIWHHRGPHQRRAFLFQHDRIKAYQPRLWQGGYWHRSARTERYYIDRLQNFEPVPLRERL